MERELTLEELLAVYGGSGEGNLPQNSHTTNDSPGYPGSPLQGEAINAANSGHYWLHLSFDGEIMRPDAVTIDHRSYDLPAHQGT